MKILIVLVVLVASIAFVAAVEEEERADVAPQAPDVCGLYWWYCCGAPTAVKRAPYYCRGDEIRYRCSCAPTVV